LDVKALLLEEENEEGDLEGLLRVLLLFLRLAEALLLTESPFWFDLLAERAAFAEAAGGAFSSTPRSWLMPWLTALDDVVPSSSSSDSIEAPAVSGSTTFAALEDEVAFAAGD
jgi:hypothetical protein